MLTREQIDAYEKEVEKNYHQEREAIRIMRKLLDASEGRVNGHQPSVAVLGAIPKYPDLPPLEEDSETPTLASKIEQICKQFPDEKWTMRRTMAYLRQVHFPMRESPEGSISAALGKLAAQKKLLVVRRGYGSVASIYQWNPEWKDGPVKGGGDESRDLIPDDLIILDDDDGPSGA